MKQMKFITFCVVFAAVFSMTSCDWELEEDTSQSFARHLRGTWISNDQSVYSGSVAITFDRITITGYWEGQTPSPGGDDNQRPFRNFTKGVPLKGFSEEQTDTNGFISGFIFIEDAGLLQASIHYTYYYVDSSAGFGRTHFLRFRFGGREEILERTE